MRRLLSIASLIVLAALALSPAGHAQELSKRLVLKDGSYQAVTKWEVKGDRVRYYSAERGEWEEMPASLVDWAATDKYNKEREAGAPPPEVQQELDKEIDADTAAEQAAAPQIAPGLRLPDFEGVFVLDAFQGQPQLLELQQNAGDLNKDMKGNILRSAINPLASAKQSIELKGAHAPVQVHSARPAVYVNVAPDQPDSVLQEKTEEAQKTGKKKGNNGESVTGRPSAGERYRLVRMQSKKGNRILGNLKIAVYGKVSQEQKFVPSIAEHMSGNWIKVTPNVDLEPGEYAVVEMLNAKEMNLYVWDFGVNPNAPANPLAWKPAPAATKPGNNQPPVLQPRPKN